MSEAINAERLLLSRAFTQFSQTSERLEAQFRHLQRETESLKQKLRAKEDEVKRAERLATLGKTAAVVAHEVRNPLAALRLFLGALSDEVHDRPTCKELIGEMEKNIASINHVVENILRFSRVQESHCSPVNLNSLVRAAISQTFPSAQGALVVRMREGALPYVSGDEVALLQALRNLLLNAAQVMKFQGEIQCVVSTDPLRRETIVQIIDTGPGIPPEMRTQIFEPFVTTRNEGTGLGLAIVRHIMEHHGGSVTATHRSDGITGAVFELRFPQYGGKRGEGRLDERRGESV